MKQFNKSIKFQNQMFSTKSHAYSKFSNHSSVRRLETTRMVHARKCTRILFCTLGVILKNVFNVRLRSREKSFTRKVYNFMDFPWKNLRSSTLIRESWKKIQNTGPSPSVFYGIKSRAQHWINLYMLPCFGFFSQKTRSVTVPKNGIYFCSARHISSYIDICHLQLVLYDSSAGILSAHIIFIS